MFHIEPMTQGDVPEVSRIERKCFSNPWPLSAYRRELRNNHQNCYLVLRAEASDHAADLPPPRESTHRIEGFRSFARFPSIAFPRRNGGLPSGPHIAGFAGMWTVYDEAHVTTIGVDPIYRGRGFGELLLLALFAEAIFRGATWLTLEVRVSNDVARRLYGKYDMTVQATRRHYYSDNGEDAHVMWSRSLRDPGYLDQIERMRAALERRIGFEVAVPSPARAPWQPGTGSA